MDCRLRFSIWVAALSAMPSRTSTPGWNPAGVNRLRKRRARNMRRPPDKPTAPGASRSGDSGFDKGIPNWRPEDRPTPAAAQQLLANLELVADWRDDLLTRMARGQL